jgi:hypothetical protein
MAPLNKNQRRKLRKKNLLFKILTGNIVHKEDFVFHISKNNIDNFNSSNSLPQFPPPILTSNLQPIVCTYVNNPPTYKLHPWQWKDGRIGKTNFGHTAWGQHYLQHGSVSHGFPIPPPFPVNNDDTNFVMKKLDDPILSKIKEEGYSLQEINNINPSYGKPGFTANEIPQRKISNADQQQLPQKILRTIISERTQPSEATASHSSCNYIHGKTQKHSQNIKIQKHVKFNPKQYAIPLINNYKIPLINKPYNINTLLNPPTSTKKRIRPSSITSRYPPYKMQIVPVASNLQLAMSTQPTDLTADTKQKSKLLLLPITYTTNKTKQHAVIPYSPNYAAAYNTPEYAKDTDDYAPNVYPDPYNDRSPSPFNGQYSPSSTISSITLD